MLGQHGIQPVTLVFNNTKDCFLHLPSKLIIHLSLHENQALELSWGHGSAVFLSWTPSRSYSIQNDNNVELSRQLGEKLGLKDGAQGFLKPSQQELSVQQVFVEPLSSDDWEILELHSTALELQLLNQIRVVFQNAVFPVWVNQHTVIYIRIASLSPPVPYGRLEQFTELIISPKIRTVTDDLINARSSTAGLVENQHVHTKTPTDLLPYPRSASGSTQTQETRANPNAACSSKGQEWGGIGNLRSLLWYMLGGARASVNTLDPVPTIPAFLSDSVYRVCQSPPGSLRAPGLVGPGAVHVLPWGQTEAAINDGPSAVTYGLLSKVLSPKEGREKAKQAGDKKTSGDASSHAGGSGEGLVEDEAVVVKVGCHRVDLLGQQRHPRKGEIHHGRVWIPQHVRTRLNIEPHSTVRLKPVKTIPRVASNIRLQPLKLLPQAESDEEIQTAFLDWLHNLCHEPLSCLTARSNVVLLPVTECKQELLLTVVKPEFESQPPDQLYLLSPTALQRTDIQIVREPVALQTVKDSEVVRTPALDVPSLDTLGGLEELSNTAFEFVSHSLMGNPLSWELVSTGLGLRGGALLITGAKGSGKSALSKALCRKAKDNLDAHVEVVECKMLKGKRAETVRHILGEIFERAVWRQPSVVLLEDLDHVTGAAASPEHEQGADALLCLHIAQGLKDVVDDLVVRSSLVCLVITSQSEHTLHPLLTEVQGSHFLQGFTHISPPDQAQRGQILRCLIRRKSSLLNDGLPAKDLEMVAKKTEGYLARDLALLLERAVHANAVHRGPAAKRERLSWRDFLQALEGFTPPSLWGVELQAPSGAGLEKVGGLRDVRQMLMDTILLPARYPVLFSSLPIRQRSGVLLYGAPGTGKTLLAGAVAKDSGMNFITVKGPELLSKYIGASEKAVRDVFQRAQAAKPCILFFDEFDSLAPRRGHDSTGVTDRVVNQLLTQLDGVEGLQGVYVLAATSRPDLIDPALLRPGRLDKSLYCPPPDREARLEILRALSAGLPLAGDVNLEQLASATELFTGADLKALLYNAQLEAIHRSLAPASSPVGDGGSGSDSDMSLSSMIFLNSSGSDDLAGEGDAVLGPGLGQDQGRALLEAGEVQPEPEQRANMWRLYFGSSYESEQGNPSLSELTLQSVSGPDAMNQELRGPSPSPAYMPSLCAGYEELAPETLEQLQMDVCTIKSHYKRADEESLRTQSGSVRAGLLLCQAHLHSALSNTRPSLSQADWRRYTDLYENFGISGEGKLQNSTTVKPGQRVTLA